MNRKIKITKDYFTKSADEIVSAKFNGVRYKQSMNGVYLVAHTDTVHDREPVEGEILSHRGIWTAPDVGLGADDRAGVFIVRRLMEEFPACGYLLSPDEETGDRDFTARVPVLQKPRVFISFDRKGVNEYVDYGMYNEGIESYLRARGVFRQSGTYSTCLILSRVYGVPCVNLCFGGDNFHFGDEYLDTRVLADLIPTYRALIRYCAAAKALALEADPDAVTIRYGAYYGRYSRPGYYDDANVGGHLKVNDDQGKIEGWCAECRVGWVGEDGVCDSCGAQVEAGDEMSEICADCDAIPGEACDACWAEYVTYKKAGKQKITADLSARKAV